MGLLLPLLGATGALAAGCALASLRAHRRPVPGSPPPANPGAPFPPGFLWGAAEDPFQHEGGHDASDWADWLARTPSPIPGGERPGRGPDLWNRFEEDFARAAADGHNAHRIGVDWSRLEPAPGAWDESAAARYERMLRLLKETHRFTVFLNLWHFALPRWAAAAGGWENPELMPAWTRFVARCAERFGPWVDRWSTMIDSQLYALGGWLTGELPPGVRDARRALRVFETMLQAHAQAWRALREALPGASVGQIYFFQDFAPRGLFVDPLLARLADHVLNRAYLDALATGEIDVWLPPAHRLRKRDPSLAGTLDWLGVNYFSRTVVGFDPTRPDLLRRDHPTVNPKSDMGWEIHPAGLLRTLRAVARRHPGLPLHVTECGVADATDRLRPRFLADHVGWARRALDEGVPLQGFFCWSLTDNWEWTLGYGPRFGLYRVDYATGRRERTRSAELFSRIARANAVPAQSDVEAALAG